jgi:hypothetical protein
VNRNVKLCQDTFDALPLRRLDESACRTFRRGEHHRTWNRIDGGQREDWCVVVIQGGLMLTVVVDQAVRRHVTVNHDLGVTVIFVLVNVFGRGDRQHADGQAQHARENPRNPHEEIVCERERTLQLALTRGRRPSPAAVAPACAPTSRQKITRSELPATD